MLSKTQGDRKPCPGQYRFALSGHQNMKVHRESDGARHVIAMHTSMGLIVRANLMRCLFLSFALSAVAADFAAVKPNVFPADDPRAKELPRMMLNDVKERMRAASLRESQAFAAVQSRAQWEAYREPRLKALRESLGEFPPVPANMRIVPTGKIEGDGFVIHNLLYETRPHFWVSANLYLPVKPPEKMPGVLLSHSHHNPKTEGELQDMGMTWARAGVAVLVPDHLGHGERRQHDFRTEKDYPKPFRVSRQDYYFRYNTNLQLSLCGESLMGWMVWDLMRGVDVLLKQPNIDSSRIILLGAVAGGGDPAGVTAALDSRIACVAPFNFGGWQPESGGTDNPDRDFAWFGDGYWESTRGLKSGARDGFAHFVIVGSVAPRKLIYSHEFTWDEKRDPAWPRLQKIFGFYDAKDSLRTAFGAGSVRNSGPGNTHCNNIGAVHRAMIYPALKAWFDMPVPQEYKQRRTTAELTCWTDKARAELEPKKLHEVLKARLEALQPQPFDTRKAEIDYLRREWTKLLGNIEPVHEPKLFKGLSEEVAGGKLSRFALDVEPGIVVPFLLIEPTNEKGKLPVVVMVAQGGKAGFLKERAEEIEAFLKAGVAVCLVDVRGTGETKAGASAERGSTRTSISQTHLILGQPLLGAQLRDLRTVLAWLRMSETIDGQHIGLWGDSFAPANADELAMMHPFDAPELPRVAEPNGAALAVLAGLFEENIAGVFTHGGLLANSSILMSPYFYVPHEAIVPCASGDRDISTLVQFAVQPQKHSCGVLGWNQTFSEQKHPPTNASGWMIERVKGK